MTTKFAGCGISTSQLGKIKAKWDDENTAFWALDEAAFLPNQETRTGVGTVTTSIPAN